MRLYRNRISHAYVLLNLSNIPTEKNNFIKNFNILFRYWNISGLFVVQICNQLLLMHKKYHLFLEDFMNQIFITIITIIFGIVGGGSTLVLTISIPAIIVYKIIRSVKYKISLFD